MTGDNLTLVNALLNKMDWSEARHKTLAQNVSNADTPDYQPKDVTPINFKDLLSKSNNKHSPHAGGLAVTNPKHISSSKNSSSVNQVAVKDQKKPYETSPAGNAVILEEQLLKMNENMSDHQFSANLYQKIISILKEAHK